MSVAVVIATAAVSLGGTAHGKPGDTATSSPAIAWARCSDVARDWDKKDAVTECGTVRVPLDYSKPTGRTLELAVTRTRAKDAAHRRGVMLTNPGGPGSSGTGPRAGVAGTEMESVGQFYDLIGFDPRGVGYSGSVHCPEMSVDALSRASARADALPTAASERYRFDSYAKANRACWGKDPSLARSMSTANIARDMDQIRMALGEEKITYFGTSWGTALGAVYRSMFDRRVEKMVLESVMAPGQSVRRRGDQLAAQEKLFQRFAAWIAKYNGHYGFGSTGTQVEAALLDLRKKRESKPGTDGEQKIDGKAVNLQLTAPREQWPEAAKTLVAYRDGNDRKSKRSTQPVPPGNSFTNTEEDGDYVFLRNTINCNDTNAARSYRAALSDRQRFVAAFPVAGYQTQPEGVCAGIPINPVKTPLKKGRSPLLLSGHAFETNTVFAWTEQMQRAIGGIVLTTKDDVHASMFTLPCTARAARSFLQSGAVSPSVCSVPEPTPGS